MIGILNIRKCYEKNCIYINNKYLHGFNEGNNILNMLNIEQNVKHFTFSVKGRKYHGEQPGASLIRTTQPILGGILNYVILAIFFFNILNFLCTLW